MKVVQSPEGWRDGGRERGAVQLTALLDCMRAEDCVRARGGRIALQPESGERSVRAC